MPRYNLIMRDELYIKLVQIAAKHGMSLGKFINRVLESVVEKYEREERK